MNKRVLIVDNRAITEDPIVILRKLKSELTNGKLDIIVNKGASVQVQCPQHADGHEKHGSCYINVDSDNAPYLWVHCFTCDLSCDFIKFVALCFDSTYIFAKKWLLENFGDTYVTNNLAENLKDIDLSIVKQEHIDESILNTFESYHPYMKKRGLSDDVIKKFDIKYDPATRCIVFPVRDKKGKLVAFTRRSVEGKKFIIDKDFNKSNLYGINHIKFDQPVYICESQINCLTLYGYGLQALGMFGAGCTYDQIKVLNKLPVRHYIIALDNDPAGHKGIKRLCNYIDRKKFVDVVIFNDKRDVNDLTKEEFTSLPIIDRADYLIKYS